MSRFCVFWIRNTIKKVTIVVPVLMTNCHVSENWKTGPVIAQATIDPNAMAKVDARPHCWDVHCATAPKAELIEMGIGLEAFDGSTNGIVPNPTQCYRRKATVFRSECVALKSSGNLQGQGAPPDNVRH